jgi:hypothetical protein
MKSTTNFTPCSSFQFASHSFLITERSRGRSEGGKNARAPQSGQLARLHDYRTPPGARRISFAVLGHCHFDFSVKIFICATKNKVQFFSCRFSRWFLISSPLGRAEREWL